MPARVSSSDAADPLPQGFGVALDGVEAHAKGAGDLEGGHPSILSLDDLLAQVQRVGVLAPMTRLAQRHLQSALNVHGLLP